MGHYTELKFKTNLKKDTPENVVNLLKRVIIERDLGHDKPLFSSEDVFKPDFDHPFFKCDRWYMLFLSTNFDENLSGGDLYEEGEYLCLNIHTEFKNYGNEIENFLSWIMPFIVASKEKQHVGYYKGETMDQQINLYI